MARAPIETRQRLANHLKHRPKLVHNASRAYVDFREREEAGFAEKGAWNECVDRYGLDEDGKLLKGRQLTPRQAHIAYELSQGMYGGMPHEEYTKPDQSFPELSPRPMEQAYAESDRAAMAH